MITRLGLSSVLRVCRLDSPLPFRTKRERAISQLQAVRHNTYGSLLVFGSSAHSNMATWRNLAAATHFSTLIIRAVFSHYSSLYSVPCFRTLIVCVVSGADIKTRHLRSNSCNNGKRGIHGMSQPCRPPMPVTRIVLRFTYALLYIFF